MRGGLYIKIFFPIASEMAQWVKVSAAKCADLSSLPGTHAVEDEEELPVGLSMCVSAYVRICVCMYVRMYVPWHLRARLLG